MSFSPARKSVDSYVSPLSSPRDNQTAPVASDEQVRRRRGKLPDRQGSVESLGSSIERTLSSPSISRTSLSWQPGQNAISTLLQPPIVRTGLRPHTSAPASSTHRPPSSKDIPPVTLTNIRQVEPAAFKPYLSQVGSLYDAFQQAKAERKRETLQRRATEEKLDIALAGTSPRHTLQKLAEIRPRPGRHGSKDSLQETLIAAAETAPHAGPKPRTEHDAAPLSTIPSVYMEEDFHLENPRTFDVVSERSDVVRRVSGAQVGDKADEQSNEANGSVGAMTLPARKPLATNAILQEKLSWYMDTVELHLISSISNASTTFFAALGSLKQLYSEAEQSVERIRKLREDLKNLDRDMAAAGLKVIGLRRRRDNLRKLGDAMTQLRRVTEGLTRCRELIDQGEHQKAMDNVEQLEHLLAGKRIAGVDELELVDLRQVKATEAVSNDLRIFKISIGKAFESRFVEILLQDLRQRLQGVPARKTIEGWESVGQRSRGGHSRSPSDNLDRDVAVDSLRAQLQSCLLGLDRCHHTLSGAAAYRDAVLREVKNSIRKHLPSSDDDDTQSVASSSVSGDRRRTQQEKSSVLARNLRALDPDEAEQLFVGIYSSIGETLRRLAVQVKVLLDLTSVVETSAASVPRSPPKSPVLPSLQGYLNPHPQVNAPGQADAMDGRPNLDMSNLLGQVVDVVHGQIIKILKVRTDQTIQLPLFNFIRYFALNRRFAAECETVSGRGGTALRDVVNGQIKEFLSRLGDIERQALAEAMDADQWDAADFTDEDDEVLQRVISSSTKDPHVWIKRGNIGIENAAERGGDGAANGQLNGVKNDPVVSNGLASSNAKEKSRRASIDEQKFVLPRSAITVLYGIERFENFIAVAPSMNQDLTSIIIDYLKLFNSRSIQLILGAGATKSAGLKNITTKHLALAFQALSFISALIPYIREFVRRQPTPSSGLLVEFDKLKRLYYEHQTGIHDKLVDIMTGRSRTHVNAMKKIDWDDTSAARPSVNPYMETLTKETITLHRVLSKHLLELDVKMVMEPIFENYRQQWGQAFKEVSVSSKEGTESLLRDAECFHTRLSKVEGAGGTGDYILDIVRQRLAEAEEASKAETVETPSNGVAAEDATVADSPDHSAALTEDNKVD